MHPPCKRRSDVRSGSLPQPHDRESAKTFSAAAFGLGLLLASAFSAFFWWWAVGAVLFVVMHVPIVMAASLGEVARAEPPHVPE